MQASSRRGAVHDVDRVGVFTPKDVDWLIRLGPGEMGFITAGMKHCGRHASVGDTITEDKRRDGRRRSQALKPSHPRGVLRDCSQPTAGDYEHLQR